MPCTGIVIGLLIEVLTAVQFDDQASMQTDEVRIETIDPMLATEFVAEQTAIAKMMPERAFGLGLQAAQAAFVEVGLWAAHWIAPKDDWASWRCAACVDIGLVCSVV
jgi:hypothetical protein